MVRKSATEDKRKIWFIHGRPNPHPLHQKYGEAIGGRLAFVDPVLRWHDKEVLFLFRYLYWLINAFWFAIKVKPGDVVMTEGVHVTALFTRNFATLLGKRIYVVALMDDEFLYFLQSGVYKSFSALYNQYFVSKYDHFFCIGDMIFSLCKSVIKDERKISKGFNGVSTERMKSLLPIDPDLTQNNIMFIGNGPSGWRAYYKGLDLILQVFNKVSEVYKAQLFIVGDWNPSFLESYIAKYSPQAKNRIVFVGKTSDLGKYLRACSVYLHPGRGEAWGISVNEAMCAGVVPIVSEWTGAAECVKRIHPDLVTSLEVNDIYAKVTAYLELDLAAKAALSHKAKEVASEYSETAAIDQFRKMFFCWYSKTH